MTTKHKTQQDYLEECVNILPEAIQEEFVRVPSDIAYWGHQYAMSLKTWKAAKLERERTEAELHIRQKELLINQGVKRPTVGDIEAAVALNPDYQSAKLHEVEMEAEHLAAKVRYQAVCAKKDMVQSLGAQIRTEMERDPSIRERASRSNGGDFADF